MLPIVRMDTKTAKIGWRSATALVVANMIGTGVFTTLGFQLNSISNTWSILLLWIIGGAMAIFGAFSYAELGTRLKRSGGEYHYLSEIFHPFLGYLSGWVSLTVGFAAPVALAAWAMGAYITKFVHIPTSIIAVAAVIGISLIHSFNIRQSSRFQNLSTLLKLVLILSFIGVGLLIIPESTAVDWSGTWKAELSKPAFAVALVYVSYSFSGWNAAAYIVDEIDAPKKNLPIALIGGTLLVSVLYIFLQFIFLRQAPLEQLQGKLEVGQVVADNIFGSVGGSMISFMIAFFLISSISAMIWVGPRVTKVMAEDYRLWNFLAVDNPNGIPVRAIWLQTAISVFLILTGSFEKVLIYSGFILQLFSSLSVFGLLVLRNKQADSQAYKSPFYPWIQITYLLLSCWILMYLLYERPQESLWGILNIAIGGLTYWWSKKMSEKSDFTR